MFFVVKKFLNIARRFTSRYTLIQNIYYFNLYGFTIFILNYDIAI